MKKINYYCVSRYLGNGGDDTPLRGGKFSDFQGGVKVAAFASGGLIPAAMRGTNVSGYRLRRSIFSSRLLRYIWIDWDLTYIQNDFLNSELILYFLHRLGQVYPYL